jgi:hypothetical protein
MRVSTVYGLLAAAAVLLAVVPAAVVEAQSEAVYVAGTGTPVVVLLDSLGETERSLVDAVAEARGGAVGMVAPEVFTSTEVRVSAQLTAAMESNGLEPDTYPVIGFGDAAHHAILLSYDAWVRPPFSMPVD